MSNLRTLEHIVDHLPKNTRRSSYFGTSRLYSNRLAILSDEYNQMGCGQKYNGIISYYDGFQREISHRKRSISLELQQSILSTSETIGRQRQREHSHPKKDIFTFVMKEKTYNQFKNYTSIKKILFK